ncbi:hypothetical protein [Bradyrhizobium sp. LA7.1]|uniref:hypothetical protein n=1 Tax=Bradyrhizobium sp. LA7.1 TaxID=3156324 RepID=UPI003399E1F7
MLASTTRTIALWKAAPESGRVNGSRWAIHCHYGVSPLAVYHWLRLFLAGGVDRLTLEELNIRRTKYIPTWSQLRMIGNSRAVQASVAFPIVGYLILLSSQFTEIFDGGIAGRSQHLELTWWTQLWSLKLYFVYFGLLLLGVGSALYQWRCPRQIKKHGDWEDYVRIDGEVVTDKYTEILGQVIDRDFESDLRTGETGISLRIQYMHQHYATLSATEKWSRAGVTFLFASGLLLLSIPSLMTIAKIGFQVATRGIARNG